MKTLASCSCGFSSSTNGSEAEACKDNDIEECGSKAKRLMMAKTRRGNLVVFLDCTSARFSRDYGKLVASDRLSLVRPDGKKSNHRSPYSERQK